LKLLRPLLRLLGERLLLRRRQRTRRDLRRGLLDRRIGATRLPIDLLLGSTNLVALSLVHLRVCLLETLLARALHVVRRVCVGLGEFGLRADRGRDLRSRVRPRRRRLIACRRDIRECERPRRACNEAGSDKGEFHRKSRSVSFLR